MITIAFIAGLYLLDVYYRRIIEAASIRARILGTVALNIELDGTISNRFKKENLSNYVQELYIGFTWIAVAIGVVVIIASNIPSSTLVNSSNLSSTPVINFNSLSIIILSSTSVDSSNLSSIPVISFGSLSITPVIVWGSLTAFLCSILLTFTYIIAEALLDNSSKSSNYSDRRKELTKYLISKVVISGFFIIFVYVLFLDPLATKKGIIQEYALWLIIVGFIGRYIARYIADKIRGDTLVSSYILDNSGKHTDFLEQFAWQYCEKSKGICNQLFLVAVIICFFIVFTYLMTRYSIAPERYFTPEYIILLFISGTAGTYIINKFSYKIVVNKAVDKKKLADTEKNKKHEEDWIIDKLTCKQDEKVRITITNLGCEEIKFEKGEKVCDVYTEDGSWNYKLRVGNENVIVPSHGNYSWLWNISKASVPEGIYRIKPRHWKVPLRRSVLVLGKTENQVNSNDIQ